MRNQPKNTMIDKIKKIAEDVFETLGSGYSEEVYEKAMEVGLRLAKIPYENQRVLPVFYKNFAVGVSKPDLIVKDNDGGEKIILELKATSSESGLKEEVQLQKYLQNLKMKKGIIINFLQTNSNGPAPEIEFRVVTDELNKCDKCGKILCHDSQCDACLKEEAKKVKESEKKSKKKDE
jgi:GxxExxY protein